MDKNMQTDSIRDLIESASHDMFNPELNFYIAKKYEELEQAASAVSFYLRAAEYGYDTHPLTAYTSLLRISIIFQNQGDRNHTVTNTLFQAIAYLPDRPEAYFLLSRFYEQSASWQESYSYACLGLFYSNKKVEPLKAYVDYPDTYVLEFEKAVSGWWLGRKDESMDLFFKLYNLPNIQDMYKNAVIGNIKRINPAAQI